MTRERRVFGETIVADEPVWEPLERAVGERLMSTFMWMYEIRTADGGRIHAYKHIDTRRYLHLDHDAGAYEFVAEQRYRPIALAEAIELAFASWHRVGASPEELADAAAAIDRARGEAE